MRMTAHKKEILTYYEPDNLEWVTGEIGPPPFDVSDVAYLVRVGLLQLKTSFEIRAANAGSNGSWWPVRSMLCMTQRR